MLPRRGYQGEQVPRRGAPCRGLCFGRTTCSLSRVALLDSSFISPYSGHLSQSTKNSAPCTKASRSILSQDHPCQTNVPTNASIPVNSDKKKYIEIPPTGALLSLTIDWEENDTSICHDKGSSSTNIFLFGILKTVQQITPDF